MSKYFNKSIFFFILLVLSSDILFSQNMYIRIQLTPPSLNQLGITDLWKMEVNNTSNKTQTVYFEGYASEEQKGLIVEGRSKSMQISPGSHNYGYNDFKQGSVTWNNKSMQEVLIRTGTAPAGIYTICVTAFDESGQVVGQENCLTHNVGSLTEQEITLIAPGDGDKIDIKEGIIFTWAPLSSFPKDGYRIKVVEIKGNQSSKEAIDQNSPWFSDKGLTSTNLSYPLTAKEFDPQKKYAWQVSVLQDRENSKELKSEVWEFSFIKGKENQVIQNKEIKIVSNLKYYYDLDFQQPDGFVSVSNDTLNVQFINNYASTDFVDIKIFDIESKALVTKKSGNEIKSNLLNGMFRLSLPLKNYGLQVNKLYSLKISDFKNNYYCNFKVLKDNEK